ncbi:MAG: asparagine synthase (glutamine-hydrolyzing) [Nitrospira sp.]|nr:asparagine synthase (glutamine-hydrolyzing) [Nitrospira sp.]
MSGLAGIYHLDSRPVEFALLERMTYRVAHRGPDASDCWVKGPIGIGHTMLQTTPESLYERQPWLDESGTICLALDGRIDNREDLMLSLSTAGFDLRADTDAELLLRAYQHWGEHCPEHVIGDFAFVVWDGHRRQLFCARDILGLKPFYYCLYGTSFYWASEIPPLFEHDVVPRRPNEAMIAEFLSSMVVTNAETLYEGISRLEPAHILIVRAGRIEARRYWTFDPGRRIRYTNDDDYARHFLDLFEKAVRCRLRSHRPIGLELSGGLDSSSVVSLLQKGSRLQPQLNKNLQTFSLVFPGLPCDEHAFIDDVVARGPFRSHRIRPETPSLGDLVQDVFRYQDFPDHPNGVMNVPLRRLAQQQGCRVLLTGSGGDEWLTGSFFHYADLLRNLKFRSLLRRLRADHLWHDEQLSYDLFSLPLVQFGLLPLIPQPCRNLGKQLLGRTSMPDWMSPAMWRRTQMQERIRRASWIPRGCSYAQQDLFRSTMHGLGVHGIEMDERASSSFGLESRHPFNDRRLIEFALALPEAQRWRNRPKFILRHALEEMLPASVRERVDKADFSCVFAHALIAEPMMAIFRSLSVSSMGWVDGGKVWADYQLMANCYSRGNEDYRFYVASLWMILGVELWFRSIFLKQSIDVQLPVLECS